jgi:CRP/FNR family cyclic AMP-dependent transcriptional regulator
MADTQHDLDAQLAGVPVLAHLSKRHRRRLLDESRVVRHDTGRDLAAEGEMALALHVVLSGRAAVTLKGQELRQLGPGDYFGEISLIDGRPRSATVTASEPMETLAVPHAAFSSLLQSEPECAQGLLQVLCARLRDAEAREA